MIVSIFLRTLILTVLIESAAAYIAGYRGSMFYITLLMANIITNPPLNYILMIINALNLQHISLYAEIILELAVIAVEYKILAYTLSKDRKKLFLLSIIMNASSYITGILLFR